MPNKKFIVHNDDKEEIMSFVQSRSDKMYKYMKDSSSDFSLWYKPLFHSDLLTKGKRTDASDGLDKNLLYYMSVEDMVNLQKQNPEHRFKSAKQSNIGMPEDFFTNIGVPKLQRRIGPQKEKHNWINLSDYMSVYLVNDTLKYFSPFYTEKIMNKLGKKMPEKWQEQVVELDKKSHFTKIDIHEAILGLGVESDKEFHALRHSLFLNDTIIFLIEHAKQSKNLFILLEKNPKFYTLAGITNSAWEKYLDIQRSQEESAIRSTSGSNLAEDEKTRKMQRAWKEMLAKEMMGYTTEEGKVFCPFTGIGANFSDFSMLFIASHIKAHKDCASDKESFDINNGLLLAANADALFDKYMITIDKDKEIVFSFLLETNYELRNKLLLNQPIFKMILNDERMKNIEEHRKIFYEKEEERRKFCG